MQPQQPGYTATPNSQFDFIVNSGSGGNNNWLLNAPMQTRIMVFVSGLVGLLVIALIIMKILAGGGTDTTPLASLAQQQAELARISLQPMTMAKDPAVQNFATTTRLGLLSDEQTLTAYLQTHGGAPSTDALRAGKNSKTDTDLQAAQTNGTYDQAYLSIAQNGLSKYALQLKQTYAATSQASERQLLAALYDHTQLLIAQSSQR